MFWEAAWPRRYPWAAAPWIAARGSAAEGADRPRQVDRRFRCHAGLRLLASVSAHWGGTVARRLGVSREDVIAAAVRIADRDGLAGLTVAAVAGEVGCRPPSIYHHVDGLDGLVRAVTLVAADHLTSLMQRTARDAEGTERLRAMATAAHQWGIEHPGRFDALRRPVDATADPEVAAARAGVLLPLQDVLVDLGVPAERRAPLLLALVAAVRGCVAADLEAPPGPNEGDGPGAAGRREAGRELLVGLLVDHVDAIRPAIAP